MSLGTVTRSLTKKAKNLFPGAADADLSQYVRLQVDVALKNPSPRTTDDDLAKLTSQAFSEAVEAGTGWAVALKNSVRDNVIKPLVAKARDKGVDPVAAVVMSTDFTQAEAAELVADLDAAEADADADFSFGEVEGGKGNDEADTSSPLAVAAH